MLNLSKWFICALSLSVQTTQVRSQPSAPHSDGTCHDDATFFSRTSNLCCKKCLAGTRLKSPCSSTADTVCEACPSGQYMQNSHFYDKCLSCLKCKENKGLEYAQVCSSTTKSMCVCQTGRYCTLGFKDPYCLDCGRYTACKPGYGVSRNGTADSDVRCKPCSDGTFSDSLSYTDFCQPHTDCVSQGGAVLSLGNATSDTVCKPGAFKKVTPFAPTTLHLHTTPSPPQDPGSELPTSGTLRKVTAPTEGSGIIPIAVVLGSVGGVLVVIIVTVLGLKKCNQRESRPGYSKTDANGNSEKEAINVNVINGDCGGVEVVTTHTLLTTSPPERQCMLGNGDGNNPSQLETDGDARPCSGFRSSSHLDGISIGSLQSTLQQHNTQPTSLQSTLQTTSTQPSTQTFNSTSSTQPSTQTFNSNSSTQPSTQTFNSKSSTQPSMTQSTHSQPSMTQSTHSQPNMPQPTSPSSPLPSSPLVNVNITLNYPLHLGNGSCAATPNSNPSSSPPPDSSQTDCELPRGREEEGVCLSQQEGGKEALMAVQESGCYA